MPFYLSKDNQTINERDDAFIKKATDYITIINPRITANDVIDSCVHRYEYGQPVTTTQYLSKLPPVLSAKRKGFLFADTAYYYPHDRALHLSIAQGKKLVQALIAEDCE